MFESRKFNEFQSDRSFLLFSPPHLIRKKEKGKTKHCHSTLPFRPSSRTPTAPTLTELTRHTPLRGPRTRGHPAAGSPRGPGSRPRLSSARGGAQGRGWGTRKGAGEGAAGLGVAFSEPQDRPPSAPRHGRIEEGKKQKGHHWLEFLEARAVFTQNTEAEPCFLSAALASPLPIFDLLLEGPVPPPRVPGVGTLVKSSWRPVSPATVPWRAPALPRRI